jgi:hypothetical protein
MAYGRRIIIKSKDPTDFTTLRNFIHELSSNSMYLPILNELVAIPDFNRKEHIIIESKNGQEFVSQIIFNNKETLDAYMDDEGVNAIWEFVKINAEALGLEIVEDYQGLII